MSAAGYNAGYAFGGIVVVIVFAMAPAIIGYLIARRLTARRKDYDPVRWPMAIGVMLSLIIVVVQIPRWTQARNEKAADGDENISLIEGISVPNLPDPKLFPASFNDFKNRLDQDVLRTVKHADGSKNFKSTVSFIKIGSRDIAYYAAEDSGMLNVARFLGEIDGIPKSVTCSSSLDPNSDACRSKVSETFEGLEPRGSM